MTLIDARDIVTQPNGWTDCDPIGHAIHHTVSGGQFFGIETATTVEEEKAHIKMIDALHVSLDYGGFGYHTITFASGRSYLTGNWRRARAHVKYRNHELVGSAAAGDFSNQTAQVSIIAGLAECVAVARQEFGRELPINGHGQWADRRAPSSCPGLIRTQLDAIVAGLQEDDMALADHEEYHRQTIDPLLGGLKDTDSAVKDELLRKSYTDDAIKERLADLVYRMTVLESAPGDTVDKATIIKTVIEELEN